MNGAVMHLYHHLPAGARSVVASARGLYLRSWRYGKDAEALVNAALERDQLDPVSWDSWRRERVGFVLHRAATRVPYYREQWAARRRRGDRASWDVLENWPVLEKESLRAQPRMFVADDCNVRTMFHEHTSGTTGTPIDLWRARATVRALYALSEARERRWYGISRHDRWAMLGGQLVVSAAQRRPPFWVWNAALGQLYLSSYHLNGAFAPCYIDALRQYEIRYLLGYTSSLYALALEVLRQGVDNLRMRVAITNAEPVFDYQRRTIAKAFQCPVRETYGLAEMVAAGSECPSGRSHAWPEVGVLEILDEGSDDAGPAGDIVATGLLNADMPLIRYRTGDTAAAAPQRPCECGKTLPMLPRIHGRIDDVVYTADGRRIGRLDPVFKAQLPVREAQVVQEAVERFRIRFVPTAQFRASDGDQMISRLRDRVGPVDVVLEPLDEVPRAGNGKFRSVVCNLPPDVRNRLEALNRQPLHRSVNPFARSGRIA